MPITPDFVMRLGYAAGEVLVRHAKMRGAGMKGGEAPAPADRQ